ncbi:MAG: hypothetical protein HRF49_05565 [bacterium]|jgi:hypothetical protein
MRNFNPDLFPAIDRRIESADESAHSKNTAPTWTNHPHALRPVESQQIQTNSATQFINVSDEISPSRRTYNPGTSAAGDTEAIAAKGRLVLVNGAVPTVMAQTTLYPSELFSHRNPTYNENTIALPSDRGALEISGTNLMYEGTRVKTWIIGRDVNPGGRGLGTYYPHGMFQIGQLRPQASSTPIFGTGNSINNQTPPPFGSDCSWSVDECRPVGGDGIDVMCLKETCLHIFDGDPNDCAGKQNAFMEYWLAIDPLRGSGMSWCFHPISGSCYIPGEGKQTVTMFVIYNRHDERCADYGPPRIGGSGGEGAGPGCGGPKPPLRTPCAPIAGGGLPPISIPGPPPGTIGPMGYHGPLGIPAQSNNPGGIPCDAFDSKIIKAIRDFLNKLCKIPAIRIAYPNLCRWVKTAANFGKYGEMACKCFYAISAGYEVGSDHYWRGICKDMVSAAQQFPEQFPELVDCIDTWNSLEDCPLQRPEDCDKLDTGRLSSLMDYCGKKWPTALDKVGCTTNHLV